MLLLSSHISSVACFKAFFEIQHNLPPLWAHGQSQLDKWPRPNTSVPYHALGFLWGPRSLQVVFEDFQYRISNAHPLIQQKQQCWTIRLRTKRMLFSCSKTSWNATGCMMVWFWRIHKVDRQIATQSTPKKAMIQPAYLLIFYESISTPLAYKTTGAASCQTGLMPPNRSTAGLFSIKVMDLLKSIPLMASMYSLRVAWLLNGVLESTG